MGIETDDIETLAQMRHKELMKGNKELIDSIKTLISKLPKETSDNGVKEAIDKLTKFLSNIPKPEKPVVNISNNNDEIAGSIKEFLSSQVKKEPEEKVLSWHHKVNRDRNGF